jgi:hypothetical protein
MYRRQSHNWHLIVTKVDNFINLKLGVTEGAAALQVDNRLGGIINKADQGQQFLPPGFNMFKGKWQLVFHAPGSI